MSVHVGARALVHSEWRAQLSSYMYGK